ncbi:uncharacterized protein BT62DRAFT_907892, partial [Guyanagaster necrorhizus]
GAYKVEQYWGHIPKYEHWGMCPICRVSEMIEHILMECQTPRRQQIWDLMKELWHQKHEFWPTLSLGMVLSSSLRKFKNLGAKTKGTKQAFCILVPEAALLIWKLHCEQQIKREDDPECCFSKGEIAGRWPSMMSQCFQQDRVMTDKVRFGSKAVWEQTVLDTWKDLVFRKDGEKLPDD